MGQMGDHSNRRMVWLAWGLVLAPLGYEIYQLTGLSLLGWIVSFSGLLLLLRFYAPSAFVVETVTVVKKSRFVEDHLRSSKNNPPGRWVEEEDRQVSAKESPQCWIAFSTLAVVGAFSAWSVQVSYAKPNGFVIAIPVGWDSDQKGWRVCEEHHGKPDSLYNLKVYLNDSSHYGYSPVVQVINGIEIDANGSVFDTPRCFIAHPSVFENEHFGIISSHSKGSLVQQLYIRRIKNKWVYAIEVNDSSSTKPGRQLPILFHCKDRDFPPDRDWPACIPGVLPPYMATVAAGIYDGSK